MAKLLSVIIPTYNRQDLTDRAIQSVVSDQPELIEIIAIDDCSDEPYRYPPGINHSGISVKVIRITTNRGPGHARAVGISCASADLIAFLDSDDKYNPVWLDRIIELWKSLGPMERKRLVVCGMADGEKTAGRKVKTLLRKRGETTRIIMARIIISIFNPFVTPSLVISREICDFHPKLRYCEDFYAVSLAIHKADRLLVDNMVACQLDRRPNSGGGLSGNRSRMFVGELGARCGLLMSSKVGVQYKIFVLLGFPYQCLRVLAKWTLDQLISICHPRPTN